MHSKPLRQAVDLALDTMGMRGPVRRREVAEQVLRAAPDDYWSLGDLHEAKITYLHNEIAGRMTATHSPEFIEPYLAHVPDKYRAMLRGIPKFICVSPRGGRDAQHVMTLFATRQDWEANFALKDHIVDATRISRDNARDIRDLLVATGSESLADLLGAKEAAE